MESRAKRQVAYPEALAEPLDGRLPVGRVALTAERLAVILGRWFVQADLYGARGLLREATNTAENDAYWEVVKTVCQSIVSAFDDIPSDVIERAWEIEACVLIANKMNEDDINAFRREYVRVSRGRSV